MGDESMDLFELETMNENVMLSNFLAPILKCKGYLPKMGDSKRTVTLDDFLTNYGEDLFYNLIGLKNAKLYSAHKASGGMTSIYRQVGIASERIFRDVLKMKLNLCEEQAKWSYYVPIVTSRGKSKNKELSLDGRIDLNDLKDEKQKRIIKAWIEHQARQSGWSEDIIQVVKGVVFEVRQGYKSKDSKRQNADMGNAIEAIKNGYLPCLVLMSNQVDTDIITRYVEGSWVILRGIAQEADISTVYNSTYKFLNDIVGYDLEGFFVRNSEKIRKTMDEVLEDLLVAE